MTTSATTITSTNPWPRDWSAGESRRRVALGLAIEVATSDAAVNDARTDEIVQAAVAFEAYLRDGTVPEPADEKGTE